MARDHLTRKELREDAFQETMFHLVDYVYQRRRRFIAGGIALLAVVLLVAAGFWYRGYRQQAIAQAFAQVEQVRQDTSLEGETYREKLLEALHGFLDGYPDSPLAVDAWLAVAEQEFQANRPDKAMQAFRTAQQHEAASSLQQVLAVVGQAKLAEQQGNVAEAQGYYESLQDGYADLREYNLARLALQQGDREAARQHLQAVTGQVPTSALARPARALLDYAQ